MSPAASAGDMIDRIFASREFAARPPSPTQWLDGGASYVVVETSRDAANQTHRREVRQRDRCEARGADRRGAAHAGRRLDAAGDRGPVVVPGCPARAGVHEHPAGLAHQLARRLLAARSAGRQLEKARRRRAGGEPDVRAVQPGRHPGRVRARQRHPRRGSVDRRDRADHAGRHGPGDQRRLRLGQRRGARSPRLLPLEPRRHPHRVLAVRPARRRELPADVLPRQGPRDRHRDPVSAARPVSADRERPVSAGGHHQFGGPGRRRVHAAAAR